MKVQLLGTGSADGWPNPFCTCSSCSTARANGDVRGQTGVLVDERILIDCGPEIPAAASRHGASLAAVELMLFTHAHPDHVGPAAFLFRHWAHRSEPLQVLAPAAVMGQIEHWIAPTDPVNLRPVIAGEQIVVGDYVVRMLEAAHGDALIGEAVLFDISDRDGRRLLYGTDTGPFTAGALDAMRGAAYDIVLLEETFGYFVTHDTDHLDLSTFPEQLRRMRAVGALTDDTDVIAVHLSHHNPPSAQLHKRLAEWGARVVPDGTVVSVGSVGSEPLATPRPHRTLVLGGARSGKSRYAESLVASAPSVTYVATAPPQPDDPEWVARVNEHQRRRPAHWVTQETDDVAAILEDAERGDVILVDCLTLWLTRMIDQADAWDGDLAVVDKQVARLLDAWRATKAQVVAVSNEVGQGVVPASASGRLFRDAQGRLNAAVASASEAVTFMVAGRPVALQPTKGENE